MTGNATRHTVVGILLILSILVTVWIGLPVDGAESRVAATSSQPADSPTTIAHEAPDQKDRETADEQRSALASLENRELTGDDADFDALLETLVKITVEASEASRSGDTARIRELDADGREVFDHILLHVEDPEDQALHRLTGLPSEDTTERGIVRRMLCVGVLNRGLSRRHKAFESGGNRRRSDQVVENALACIPQDETVAHELSQVLTDSPYLGVAHESAVLDLCALAAEERYLLPLVTGLLETLWHNLCAEGARTSAELVHLALLFRGDNNPAKRLVALRHLLVVDDGRYRDLAIQEVIAARDDTLIEQLTMTVATKLPPKEAAETLQKLSLVSTRSLMPAFLALGDRDAEILAKVYEQKLADGTRADFRAELVTGVGFQGGPEGMAIARLAFDTDPDPEVRTRAMFILTAHADAAEAEKILTAVMSDPAFRDQPTRLGQVVLALENLAATADPNIVDRIGRGLQSAGKLLAGDRARLERILDRSLPKGDATPKFPGRGQRR